MARVACPGHWILWAGALLLAPLSLPSSASAGVPELPADAGSGLELRIDEDATVVVSGLGDAAALSHAASFDDDDWRQLLQVVARDPDRSTAGADLPPLLGSYVLDGSTLRFAPRFPPAPGLVVEARFSARHWQKTVDSGATEALATALTASYRVPRHDLERTTHVEAVYPATETVPANLLRFYVHFSASMGARRVLPHVALLDSDGQAIDTAFVEVDGGLWDPSRTRLTLFVHPGRIKRGVGPNQALGPVLEEGNTYTLRVGADATDDLGRRLAEPYEHVFRVGPEDHISPDPERWTLTPPNSLKEPLRVELVEAADVALLQRMPVVVDVEGGLVEGRIEVSADGSSFRFRPDAPWAPGHYELRVPTTLEDASGNRVERRFEEAESSESDAMSAQVSLRFEVGLTATDS